MIDTPLTLFHAPNTRSTGARILLEELGAPYEIAVLDMKAASSGRRRIWRSTRSGRCRPSGMATRW